MEKEQKKGSQAAPWIAAAALAGVAAAAFFAYRRRQAGHPCGINDLLGMADRAARALDDRVNDYAIAS